MRRAVTFELDGTLADTIADVSVAINQSLACRDLPLHDSAEYRSMVGDGFRLLVMRVLPPQLRGEVTIEELRAEAIACYAEHCLDLTTPNPGVPELLAFLAERGVARTVLSNKPNELSLKVVSGLFAQDPSPPSAGRRLPSRASLIHLRPSTVRRNSVCPRSRLFTYAIQT